MARAADHCHLAERSSEGAAQHSFGIHSVSQSEARAPTRIPSRHEATSILAARSEARKTQSAGIIVHGRIRPVRCKIGVLVAFIFHRRTRELEAQSKVESQLRRKTPVVL